MAGFSFGTSTTSAPAFSLGNTSTSTTPGFNFPSATSGTPAQQVQFNSPAATQGGLSFSTPATTANTGFSFGSTGGLGQSGGLTFGTPTSTQQPALSFGGATATTGLSFGSAATSNQPNLPTFGSTATAGQSTLPTFGSTATSVQSTLPTFGSAATAGQPTLPTFGSTAATSGQSTLPTFGSTAAATAQPTLPTFGSTATTGQPTLPTFGSTATSGQSTLPTFGSSAPATSQTLTFGTPAATTQPSLSFGTTPATTQAGLSFGAPATTAQQTLGFGLTAPAATTTASTGFSLGTPASTASGLTFGLGGAKPATTTAAPSLLNFAAPKTTATTGFSVSGTTTGTSSLFSLPTSAPATATTTATTPFKGLGGVDTSTTQGSGQKDAKSAKENVVNPEIMQTLDVFKNFVKQQKTLSCEVSRAPVKPMHKVTEDADALKNLLTSVSSTLQKNRVFANKLKNDTTKCLSLCEMAQRTHDTPPGLQNDNVAPLEFFIQLVSKFERDIQLLRQEIDNTEKHVTSLSHPAILTPQELSVALRRLHDSFVALAGRLQTAHAGVIAQKERHLSLRRHFLKDSTNIFDSTSRTTAKKSQSSSNLMPMPGPTPFSSLGGLPNLNLVASQDKASTFSTGNTTLPAWGSSAIPGLSSNTSSLLQSPGTGLLTSPQPVDNQSFQLGKPPPGNKRGKR